MFSSEAPFRDVRQFRFKSRQRREHLGQIDAVSLRPLPWPSAKDLQIRTRSAPSGQRPSPLVSAARFV